MNFCATTNGQHWQVGTPSQPSQPAPHLIARNLQASTANKTCHHRALNSGVQPQQSTFSLLQNAASSNGQTSNWQTSASPNQIISSQQTAGGKTNKDYPRMYGTLSFDNCQNSSTNMQHANPHHGQDIPHHHPPTYLMATSQSFSNNNIAMQSSSSALAFYVSSTGQKTQQYVAQGSSAHSNGGNTTFSSNSNSFNQNLSSHVLEKTNKLPLNPAVTQQFSTDSLCKSYTAGFDGLPPAYTSSQYGGQQFVNKARTILSNQNMQPATSAFFVNYNLNATQSLPLQSRQSLPGSSSRILTQHTVNAPPQQNSIPNVLCFTSAGDGGSRSKTDNAFLPNSNRVSEGSHVGSSSDASQLLQMPESISPQRHMTQSAAAASQIHEIIKMLLSAKPNDSSIHSTPGHSGTKAVAVVQPLSLESCQTTSKHTSSNTLTNPENVVMEISAEKNSKTVYLREESNLNPANPDQMRSNKSVHAPKDDTVFLASNSWPQNLKQTSQMDIAIAPTVQKSVPSEVTVSKNCPKDLSVIETPQTPPVSKLLLLPTTPWTASALLNLILNGENAQKNVEDLSGFNCAHKLLFMFWDSKGSTLASKLKTGWYKDIITEVTNFCATHVTLNSVVLLQMKGSCGEQLKNCHVLKDEVDSELPYKSSWLNVNDQLDDIDKEFGFPWMLKSRLHMFESDSQTEQLKTVNSGSPARTVTEVSNKVLPQTELGPVDSAKEEQVSTVEAPTTDTVYPAETESADSSDPYYSFKIHVLPPEEAKLIFEEAQSKMPQSMDTDSQAEKVTNSSVEIKVAQHADATSSESKLKTGAIDQIEQVCCISRYVEIVLGTHTKFIECLCKEKQSGLNKESTNKTLDMEEKAVQNEKELCEVSSDSKVPLTMEGENPTKCKENIANPSMTFSFPEVCSELSQTIDLTDNDNKCHSSSDQEPNISQIISSSQSSIILTSDSSDEDLSNSENEQPNQMRDLGIKMSEPGDECVQEQLKTPGTVQSIASVSSDEFYNIESKVDIPMSDDDEGCGQAQLQSADVAMETNGQTEISSKAALQTFFSCCVKDGTVERKQKRLRNPETHLTFLKEAMQSQPPVDLDSQPVSEGVSKCGMVSVDATDAQPSASIDRTAELVLFGSAQHGKGVLTGDRKRHISSPEGGCDTALWPPEVLSVILSPLKCKSSEAVQRQDCSVKQRIYKLWSLSFSPTTTRRRNKLKLQKCSLDSLSGLSVKKNKLPVPPEKILFDGKIKRRLCLKRKSSLSNGLSLGEETTKKDTVALKQPTNDERSNTKNESQDVMNCQENDVLRFSVLPNAFDFKDGSNGRKETTDPDSDKPALVEEKDQSTNKAVMNAKDTWHPSPKKKYCPLRSLPVPKNSRLFYEFQKKYKEMTQ